MVDKGQGTYNCFNDKDDCISTQTIDIKYHDHHDYIPEIYNHFHKDDLVNVYIDNRTIAYPKLYKLAINDGFDSIEKFFEWFNKDFTGKIIHWTNLKY